MDGFFCEIKDLNGAGRVALGIGGHAKEFDDYIGLIGVVDEAGISPFSEGVDIEKIAPFGVPVSFFIDEGVLFFC